MDQAKAAVTRFLKKHGMYPGDVDLEKICVDFENEMVEGLSSYNSASSLLMLPTFINIGDKIPCEEPVIVIDAGGTNLRTAVVRFDKDTNCVISDFSNHPMPGSKGVISKKEFFETIYGYLEPILDRSSKIGFCFSYAVTITPNRDGRVIELSKEVMVDGLIGELINENLLDVIKSHRKYDGHTIIQINDTAATLLGGMAAYPHRAFESYIGLILGTGTNTCYIEDCANISKLSEVDLTRGQTATYAPGNTMLINIESGSFTKAPLGDIDAALDNKMKDPGRYQFEKAMSGGYQGILMTEMLHTAAAEGLFSPGANARFAALSGLESRDLDSFLYYPYGSNVLAVCAGTGGAAAAAAAVAEAAAGAAEAAAAAAAVAAAEAAGAVETAAAEAAEAAAAAGAVTAAAAAVAEAAAVEDARKLYYMTDALFERAAMFTAANVTAIMRKTKMGGNPNAPVCVTADGSTFYKSKLLRAKLDRHIQEFTNERCGLYCDFIKAENGVLTGTAIAALQNS